MGKYTELALNLREQKIQEDEAMMLSIKDKYLTDVAEQIGRNGYARFDLGAPKPDWWNYGYNGEVLIRWAEGEGFDVSVERFRGYGQIHVLIIKLNGIAY